MLGIIMQLDIWVMLIPQITTIISHHMKKKIIIKKKEKRKKIWITSYYTFYHSLIKQSTP